MVTGFALSDSLRRITSSLKSTSGSNALQALVDAICDHTEWQFCRFDYVDVVRGLSEAAARRDKLAYQPGRPTWPSSGSPVVKAIRSGLPVLIHDAQNNTEFPEYAADARRKGYRCGVVIPVGRADQNGRMLVFSAQSKHELLNDEPQLQFLQIMADLAALCDEQTHLSRLRREFVASQIQASALQDSVFNALTSGASAQAVLALIEQALGRTLMVLDQEQRIVFAGTAPTAINGETADQWAEVAQECADEILAMTGDDDPKGSTVHHLALRALSGETMPTLIEPIGASSGGHIGTLIVLDPSASGTDGEAPVRATARSTIVSVLARDEAVRQTQLELRAGLLDQLFQGEWRDDEEILIRGQHLGLDLRSPHWLVAAHEESLSTASEARLLADLEAELQSPGGAHVLRVLSGIAVLVPTGNRDEAVFSTWLSQRLQRLQERRTKLRLGIAGPCNELADYRDAWDDCQLAIDLARNFNRTGPVRLRDFGATRFLVSTAGTEDVKNFIDALIGNIITYDREHKATLVETLEKFVASGGRFQQTASSLHIHVSTLRYRIGRIEDLCGVDLKEDDARFEYGLAVRLHRIRSASSSLHPNHD